MSIRNIGGERMVLCNLIKKIDKGAIYAYGATVDDITGIIEFNISEGYYEIIKEPDKNIVYERCKCQHPNAF